MSRLDEIRENLKTVTDWYVDNGEFVDDIKYLLNEVDRLKEVLRKISVPMPGSRDNELVKYYERIAKEALDEMET